MEGPALPEKISSDKQEGLAKNNGRCNIQESLQQIKELDDSQLKVPEGLSETAKQLLHVCPVCPEAAQRLFAWQV